MAFYVIRRNSNEIKPPDTTWGSRLLPFLLLYFLARVFFDEILK